MKNKRKRKDIEVPRGGRTSLAHQHVIEIVDPVVQCVTHIDNRLDTLSEAVDVFRTYRENID